MRSVDNKFLDLTFDGSFFYLSAFDEQDVADQNSSNELFILIENLRKVHL